MKKLTYVLIFALASIFVLFAGCGGKAKTPAAKPIVSPQSTPEGMEVQVPEWYAKPPSDNNYLYAP
ncbi:MAG: hypothetical protein AAB116_04625, partial [Candidatus Poribacteria bacterium]